MSNKKFKDLPVAQQKILKAEGRRLVLRLLFNGINFGGLIALSNIALILLLNIANVNSTSLLFVAAVTIDIILLRMMSSSNKEATDRFKEKVKTATDAT